MNCGVGGRYVQAKRAIHAAEKTHELVVLSFPLVGLSTSVVMLRALGVV
jgi:hypothetical protein